MIWPRMFKLSIFNHESSQKSRNTARHNDELSLYDLFLGVKKLLSANGKLSLIYPYEQKEQLFNTAEKFNLHPSKTLIIRGNENKEPNRIIAEFTRQKIEIKTAEIAVRNSLTNSYSAEYKDITKNYYLDIEPFANK